MAFTNYPPYQTDEEEEPQDEQPQQPSANEPSQDEPPQQRINAAPRNNIYAPGTGKGTGRTAVRMGTTNRDGSTSPVDAMGAATGPLSQPLPRMNSSPAPTYSSGQQNQQTGSNTPITGGLPSRPGRINAAPRNNIYAPGTGPGTGRTAVRMGTINRDGSTSPVDAMGAATGPLSQPTSRWMTPRPPPAQAFAQRQANVDQAKANGTFDAAREKFNAANPGHSMDESGNITQRGAAPGTSTPLFFRARQPGGAASAKAAKTPATPAQPAQFASAPDGQGGTKMVKLPSKPAPAAPATPAAPAQQSQFASAPDGQGGTKMVKLPPKPAPAAPSTPPATSPAAQPSAPRPPLAAAAGPAPAGKSALTINIPNATHTGSPKPPFAAAGQTPAGKPALTINIPSATQTATPKPPAAATPNAPASTPPANPPPAPPTKAPATFEGQSRDKFFGDAQRRQGLDNAYSKAPKGSPAQPGASAPAPTPKTKRK